MRGCVGSCGAHAARLWSCGAHAARLRGCAAGVMWSPCCAAWLGPDLANHVVMLVYMYCNNLPERATTFMACPQRTSLLRLPAVGQRLPDFLHTGAYESAGAGTLAISQRARPALERASQAMFSVASNFQEVPKTLSLHEVIVHPLIAAIVAPATPRFTAPALPAIDATMAVLPRILHCHAILRILHVTTGLTGYAQPNTSLSMCRSPPKRLQEGTLIRNRVSIVTAAKFCTASCCAWSSRSLKKSRTCPLI